MKIIFFDTETTGNTGKDYLCQLAIKELGKDEPIINALYKPPVPIPIECTMIHNISNKTVADRPAFQDAPEYSELKELFESEDVLPIAHNAAFDVQMLKNESIIVPRYICTLKVIQALDTAGEFAMYKLQYLRYALDMDIDVPAHDALADVLVLEKLFAYELNRMTSDWHMDEAQALKEMVKISTQPMTFRHLTFGKYKGKTIEEVLIVDRGYLEWLLSQKKQSDVDETDWIHTLEKYLSL
ncbi:MAG TPA: exonuclease domain-containing protein [Candidatus Paceibacterota bacterium]|nr:exonuclease domain-containing protein [Candidatus Paceibacterota bacterium]